MRNNYQHQSELSQNSLTPKEPAASVNQTNKHSSSSKDSLEVITPNTKTNPKPQLKPELKNEKKQRLVRKYMDKLMKDNPSLYYASTTEIAHSLHPMIKEHLNRMPVEDQALLRNITVRDIEMLLSFK